MNRKAEIITLRSKLIDDSIVRKRWLDRLIALERQEAIAAMLDQRAAERERAGK